MMSTTKSILRRGGLVALTASIGLAMASCAMAGTPDAPPLPAAVAVAVVEPTFPLEPTPAIDSAAVIELALSAPSGRIERWFRFGEPELMISVSLRLSWHAGGGHRDVQIAAEGALAASEPATDLVAAIAAGYEAGAVNLDPEGRAAALDAVRTSLIVLIERKGTTVDVDPDGRLAFVLWSDPGGAGISEDRWVFN